MSTTAITRINAASAPATGAGSTSGVEISPFTNALSLIGMASRLLNLCAGDFYHVCPFFDVLEQRSLELLGRLYQRYGALLEPSFLYLRFIDDFIDVCVEESDDFLRGAFWRHHAKPDRCLIA